MFHMFLLHFRAIQLIHNWLIACGFFIHHSSSTCCSFRFFSPLLSLVCELRVQMKSAAGEWQISRFHFIPFLSLTITASSSQQPSWISHSHSVLVLGARLAVLGLHLSELAKRQSTLVSHLLTPHFSLSNRHASIEKSDSLANSSHY
jgi:hypothetical protein